jgi:hypothetical protein
VGGGWLDLLRDSPGFRMFMERGVWPLGVLVCGIVGTHYQHKEVTAKVTETKQQVDQIAKDRGVATKAEWQAVAAPVNQNADVLKALGDRLTSIEKTQASQSALIAAMEKDFIVEGHPAANRKRIDPALVQAVRANAVKDSKELAARAAKPRLAVAKLPLEPPKPPVIVGPPDPPPAPPAASPMPLGVAGAPEK